MSIFLYFRLLKKYMLPIFGDSILSLIILHALPKGMPEHFSNDSILVQHVKNFSLFKSFKELPKYFLATSKFAVLPIVSISIPIGLLLQIKAT